MFSQAKRIVLYLDFGHSSILIDRSQWISTRTDSWDKKDDGIVPSQPNILQVQTDFQFLVLASASIALTSLGFVFCLPSYSFVKRIKNK